MWLLKFFLRVYEVLFLGFSAFYMFPHVLKNVINNTDNFRLDQIRNNLFDDFWNFQSLYYLFFTVLIIWLIGKYFEMKAVNKREIQIEQVLEQLSGDATMNTRKGSPASIKKGNKCNLSISDWITILSGAKFGIMSNILSITAVIVAMVALIYSTSSQNWGGSIANAVVVTLILAFYLKTVRPLQRKSQDANEILKRIISGELDNPDKISKAWNDQQIKYKKH